MLLHIVDNGMYIHVCKSRVQAVEYMSSFGTNLYDTALYIGAILNSSLSGLVLGRIYMIRRV